MNDTDLSNKKDGSHQTIDKVKNIYLFMWINMIILICYIFYFIPTMLAIVFLANKYFVKIDSPPQLGNVLIMMLVAYPIATITLFFAKKARKNLYLSQSKS